MKIASLLILLLIPASNARADAERSYAPPRVLVSGPETSDSEAAGAGVPSELLAVPGTFTGVVSATLTDAGGRHGLLTAPVLGTVETAGGKNALRGRVTGVFVDAQGLRHPFEGELTGQTTAPK